MKGRRRHYMFVFCLSLTPCLRLSFSHFSQIISTPSEDEWPQMLRDGKIAGFRHVAMLRVNDRMTKALAKGVRSFKLEE